jgi:hypothetical protein
MRNGIIEVVATSISKPGQPTQEVIVLAGVEGGRVTLRGERTKLGWRLFFDFVGQPPLMLAEREDQREIRRVSKTGYNGFLPTERNANCKALRKEPDDGSVPKPTGPRILCGDPNAELEYHSEDYAKPYRCSPPAAYGVCRHCHLAATSGRSLLVKTQN